MHTIKITICKNGACEEYKIPQGYGFDLEEMISLGNIEEAERAGAVLPHLYIKNIEIEN
jgi:hypothetical protein